MTNLFQKFIKNGVEINMPAIPEVNTKTFQLSGTSDLTTAQAILDYYNEDNNPVIYYADNIYTISYVWTDHIDFIENEVEHETTSGTTSVSQGKITINFDSGEVTTIVIGSEPIISIGEQFPGMTILSYGHSTWQNFLDAYNKNAIVYTRASSNSNPASGSQTRMAFMAYVNNAANPTEVEFQYYRSRSDHNSQANQLDQVFVYKLAKTAGRTVTTRDTAAKPTAGTGVSLTYGSGNMVIANTLPFNPGNTGTTGQVIKKTASGYEWANESGGGGGSYTAGNGIDITNDVISIDDTVVATQTDLSSKANASDVNTKTFYLSGTSGATALAEAQAAYDYYINGGTPIIKYDYMIYILSQELAQKIEFSSRIQNNKDTSNNIAFYHKLTFNISSGQVSSISSSASTICRYLDTNINSDYSTPYTPIYDGSPATKKYVDDNVKTYTAGSGINISNQNEISVTGRLEYSDLGTPINLSDINIYAGTYTNSSTGETSTARIYTKQIGIGVDEQSRNTHRALLDYYNGAAELYVKDVDVANNTIIEADYMSDKILSNKTDENGRDTETYEFQGGGNNQIARLKDVPSYSAGTGLTLNGTTFSADTTVLATKADIANLSSFEVVASLPSVSSADSHTIYLLGPIGTGADKYEEWIVTEDSQQQKQWTKIGETSIDLTNYFNTSTQTSDVITEGSTNLFLTSAERTKLGNTSGVNTGDQSASDFDIKDLTDSTGLRTAWSGKQDALTAGTNIQIDTSTNTISATDTTYNAGEGIEIKNGPDYSAMQGPAPRGFHVPLSSEWVAVKNIWTALGGGSSDGINFGIALKLPLAGYRGYSVPNVYDQGTNGRYWSSSQDSYDGNNAYYLGFNSSILYANTHFFWTFGHSVRCFKNSSVMPTSSWIKLYGTSIESGGIFWSSTDGLISLSSDGQTWITIADKNLGATTVWNDGDTLSEANCGKYYQRGNNYGFPRASDATITTSSTQVDASNYGPGNYYSSSTYIGYRGAWDVTVNGNLWGGVTGVVTYDNAIINTGVLSVNGQTGNVTITTPEESNTKTFYLSSTSDLTNAQAAYDWYAAGKNPIIAWAYGGINYVVTSKGTNKLTFKRAEITNADISNSYSEMKQQYLVLNLSSNTVTSITSAEENVSGSYLKTNVDYSTPYTPLYYGSPATKKYVDDNVAYVGSSAPSSPSEGRLWYDTTNDVLKAYDGTNWNTCGGGGGGDVSYSQFEFVAAQSTSTAITIEHLNTSFQSGGADFTVSCGNVKEGMQYVLRITPASVSPMPSIVLGTGVTNPYQEDLTLYSGKITTVVFFATSNSTLEIFSVRTSY